MRTIMLWSALWLGLAACAGTGAAGGSGGGSGGSGGEETAPAVAEVGRRAPDFGLTWLNRPDAPGTLGELRGRVVLLEFWRTW